MVAHALLVIIWHVLATGTPYDELGADYFTRRLDPERETRRLIASSKPSATRSASSQPPDHPAPQNPAPLKLRRVLPPAQLGPFTYQREIPRRWPGALADQSASRGTQPGSSDALGIPEPPGRLLAG